MMIQLVLYNHSMRINHLSSHLPFRWWLKLLYQLEGGMNSEENTMEVNKLEVEKWGWRSRRKIRKRIGERWAKYVEWKNHKQSVRVKCEKGHFKGKFMKIRRESRKMTEEYSNSYIIRRVRSRLRRGKNEYQSGLMII